MPELPEVETVVRTLRPRLLGRLILTIAHCRRDLLNFDASRLPGRRVTAIRRRGKRILIDLDGTVRLCIHLGMTGQLTADSPSAEVRPHTHLRADIEGKWELRFRDPRRFGGIRYIKPNQTGDEGLGPEPLGMRWQDLARQLARTRRAIKIALLDQKLIAGIGNIYADESLFAAGIHPKTPACKLSPQLIRQLNRAIQQVLRQAIAAKGSTLRDYMDANGQPGNAQDLHKVYGQTGQPCSNCGKAIKRIVLGGRSTHFCGTCQK